MIHSGRQTACASQIRQIAQATSLYSGEHEGNFPTMKSNAVKDTWQIQIAPYLKITIYTPMPTPKIFRCPSQFNKAPINYDSIAKGDVGINRMLVNIFGYYQDVKLSQVAHTLDTIIISDHIGSWQRDIHSPRYVPYNELMWRHQGGINFGFVDGHMEWLSFDTFIDRGYDIPDNWEFGWRDGLIY